VKLSFYNDRESLKNQVSSLDRADIYPTQITEGSISLVRKDCHWSHDFPIIIPNANQRITSYLIGFSFVYTYPFTLGFKPAIDPVILNSIIFSMLLKSNWPNSVEGRCMFEAFDKHGRCAFIFCSFNSPLLSQTFPPRHFLL